MRTKKSTVTRVLPSSINYFADAAWQFARRVLWRVYPLSPSEKQLSKIYVREYFENIPAEIFSRSVKKYFSEYCERILLARKYFEACPNRCLPHPCIYLDLQNLEGFSATKAWYECELRAKKKRKRIKNGLTGDLCYLRNRILLILN